jgi:hypothetical protein
MAKFRINNKETDPSCIWFHYQKVAKPGGNNYELEIDIKEEKIIKELESLVKLKITEKKFCEKIIECNDSFYNPIRYTLSILKKDGLLNNVETKWVLNNITISHIENDKLYITGEASDFIT